MWEFREIRKSYREVNQFDISSRMENKNRVSHQSFRKEFAKQLHIFKQSRWKLRTTV